VEADAHLYGLHLNNDKTELWGPNLPGNPGNSGIEILGGPIGDAVFANKLVRVEKINRFEGIAIIRITSTSSDDTAT
jgi:hypothetical protein